MHLLWIVKNNSLNVELLSTYIKARVQLILRICVKAQIRISHIIWMGCDVDLV